MKLNAMSINWKRKRGPQTKKTYTHLCDEKTKLVQERKAILGDSQLAHCSDEPRRSFLHVCEHVQNEGIVRKMGQQ